MLQLSPYEKATGSFSGRNNPCPSAVCHSLVSVTLGSWSQLAALFQQSFIFSKLKQNHKIILSLAH